MSEKPPKPPYKRTKSDANLTVTKYREKLSSIEDGVMQDSLELEKTLLDYLNQHSTPPPKLNQDDNQDDIDTVRIPVPPLPKDKS